MTGRGRVGAAALLAPVVLVSVALATAGCTTPTASPAPGSSTVSPSSGPGMTGIAEAARCTSHAGADQGVPALPKEKVFATTGMLTWSPPAVTSLGPDGANLARCPGELPQLVQCNGGAPWAGIDQDQFLTASGATRDVQQEVGAYPADATNTAPDTPGARVLTYRYLDLPADDTRDVLGYQDRAFARCVHAKPAAPVAGLSILKGTASSEFDPKITAEWVLLKTDRRVGWLLLDGSGWSAADRARALEVVADYTASAPST